MDRSSNYDLAADVLDLGAAESGDQERELFEANLRAVLRMPGNAGVQVIRYFLDRLGMYSSSFTGDDRTFYLCGRRDAAQEIYMDCCNVDPKAAIQILNEGFRRQARTMKIRNKED